MTISALARAAGLSRSTVLYYESVGLLPRASRSSGNYRVYGEEQLRALRQICAYRAAGLTVEDIRALLHQPGSEFVHILQKRLVKLEEEMDRLREHQRALGRLLHGSAQQCDGGNAMTKEKWVEIMRASGLSEENMHRWHAQFEQAAPEDHEEFLRFLHIPDEEVRSIRNWSRSYSVDNQPSSE